MATSIEQFKERYKNKTVTPLSNPSLDTFKQRYASKDANNWIASSSKVLEDVYSFYSTKKNKYINPTELKEYYDNVVPEIDTLLKNTTASKYLSSLDDDYSKKAAGLGDTLSGTKNWLDQQLAYWSSFESEEAYKSSPEYYSTITQMPYFDVISKNINKSEEVPTYDDLAKITAIVSNKPYDKIGAIAKQGEDITEEQSNVYDYIYATSGEATAKKYLEYIQSDRALRGGETIASETNGFMDTLKLGIDAGLNQSKTGIESIVSKKPVPYSSLEIASNIKSQDLKGTVGGVLYDLTVTTANMLPSIFLSAVTGAPIVGAAFMGMTSGGNAYNQARLEGYSDGQAALYGSMIGVLEGGLQYLLGGVTKLGGIASTPIGAEAIRKIGNVTLRIAADIGNSMAAEGFEEYLQDILNPIVRNIALGEDNNFKLFTEEALYSALLGALSGGLFEGGNAIGSNISNNNIGERLIREGRADNVIDAGIVFGDIESMEKLKGKPKSIAKEINKLATQLKNKSIPANALNIGELSSLIDSYLIASKAEPQPFSGVDIQGLQVDAENARIGKPATMLGTSQPVSVPAVQKPEVVKEVSDIAPYEEASMQEEPAAFNQETSEEVSIKNYIHEDGKLTAVMEDGTKLPAEKVLYSGADNMRSANYALYLDDINQDLSESYINNYEGEDYTEYTNAYTSILEGVIYGYDIDNLKEISIALSKLPEKKVNAIYDAVSKTLSNEVTREEVRVELGLSTGDVAIEPEEIEPPTMKEVEKPTEKPDAAKSNNAIKLLLQSTNYVKDITKRKAVIPAFVKIIEAGNVDKGPFVKDVSKKLELDEKKLSELYDRIDSILNNKPMPEPVKKQEVAPVKKKEEKPVVKKETIEEVKKTDANKKPLKEVYVLDSKGVQTGDTINIISGSFERTNDSDYNSVYSISARSETGFPIRLFDIHYKEGYYNTIRDYTLGLATHGLTNEGIVFINNYDGKYPTNYINAFNLIIEGIIDHQTLDYIKSSDKNILLMSSMNEKTIDNIYTSLKNMFDKDSDQYDIVPAKLAKYKKDGKYVKKEAVKEVKKKAEAGFLEKAKTDILKSLELYPLSVVKSYYTANEYMPYQLTEKEFNDIVKTIPVELKSIPEAVNPFKEVVINGVKSLPNDFTNADFIALVAKMDNEEQDNLEQITIDGNNIIRNKDTKEKLKYIYRAVSKEEFQNIIDTKKIKSNQSLNIGYEVKQGLTVYSHRRPSFYLPEEGGFILKIKVSDNNKLFMDKNDGYIKTAEAIPASQIEEVNGKPFRISVESVKPKETTAEIKERHNIFFDKATNSTRNGGAYVLLKDKKVTKFEAAQYTALRIIGEKFGLKFIITDYDIGMLGEKSYYEEGTNVIYLDPKLKDKGILLHYASMEAFNYIKSIDPNSALLLQNQIINRLKEKGEYDNMKKKALHFALPEEADSYIAANTLIETFTDRELLTDIYATNPTILAKISAWLESFLKFIEDAINKLTSNFTAVKYIKKDLAFIKEKQGEFIKALTYVETLKTKKKSDTYKEFVERAKNKDDVSDREIPEVKYVEPTVKKSAPAIKEVKRQGSDAKKPSEVVTIKETPEQIADRIAKLSKEKAEPADNFNDILKEYKLTPEQIAAEEKKEANELLLSNAMRKSQSKKMTTTMLDRDGVASSKQIEAPDTEDYWDKLEGEDINKRVAGAQLIVSEGNKLNAFTHAAYAMLDAYGRGLGINFIITDRLIGGDPHTRGVFLSETNYIILHTNLRKSVLLQVAGHELFHYTVDIDPYEASHLIKDIIDKIKKEGATVNGIAMSYDDLYGMFSTLYKDEFSKMSYAQRNFEIRNEICANSFLGFLENPKWLNYYAKKYGNDKLFNIANSLDYIINTIEAGNKQYHDGSVYMPKMSNSIQDVDYLKNIYRKTLDVIMNNRETKLVGSNGNDIAVTARLIGVDVSERRLMLYDVSPMLNKDIYPETSIYDKYDSKLINAVEEDLADALSVTKVYVPTQTLIEDMYRDVAKITETKLSMAEFVRRMTPVFNIVSRAKKQMPTDLMYVTSEVMSEMIAKSDVVDNTRHDYMQDGIDYLRTKRVMFDQSQKDEMRTRFGTFVHFKNKIFTWAIVGNNGTPVKEVWAELTKMYPDIVEGINKDLPIGEKLYEFVELSKPIYIGADERLGMTVNDLAYELSVRTLSKYMEVSAEKMADKDKIELLAKIDRLNERLTELRTNKNEKIKKLHEQYMIWKHEAEEKIRENYKKKEVRASIKKHFKDLYNMIIKPTKKKHVPEILRSPIAEILMQIDLITESRNYGFTTKNQKYFSNAMNRLANVLEKAGSEEGIYGINIPPDMVSQLKDMALQVSNLDPVVGMTLTQLKGIRNILKSLKGIVNTVNAMVANKRYSTIEEAAMAFINETGEMTKKTPAFLLPFADFTEYSLADAFTVGNRLGKAASTLIDGLYEGSLKRTRVMEKAITWFEKEVDPFLTKELIDNSKPKDFSIGGEVISLTKTQVMDLYNLMRREQARGHVLGDGILGDLQYLRKSKHSKPKDSQLFKPTIEEVDAILESLSEKEIEIAEKIQQYIEINLGGVGNETSMELYQYNAFTAENAYPITVHKAFVDAKSTAEKNANSNAEFLAALNQSFTKEVVEGARKPIVIRDIFDVFTNQVIGMASYAGYSAPLLDMVNWLNFADGTKSVRLTMDRAFGTGAYNYIARLMEDINGERSLDTSLAIFSKAIGNYKAAAVGLNLRVAIQQPSAYIRALAVIDGDVLIKALAMKPNTKEMHEYSTIGRWKAYGFLENSLGISMKKLIVGFEGDTGYERFKSKVSDWALFAPQKLDDITWGTLWNAVKLQVDKTTMLEKGSEQYMEEVTRLFDQVIRETQVVDTLFHKSHFMRNKDPLSKIASAFMSEPLKMYNQMLRSIDNLKRDNSPENRAKLARNSMSILLQILLNCSLKSVVDMIRDDDDEKNMLQKYIDSLKLNVTEDLNPLGYIPYARDIVSIYKGYDASRFDMQGIQYLVYGVKEFIKIMSGEGGEWLRIFNNVTKGVSYLMGLPFNSLWRDMVAIYNTIYGKPYEKLLYREKYGRMYEYIEEGKTARYDEYVQKVLSEGKTMSDIYTGLGTALFENDPNITVLAELKRGGNASQYETLFNEMTSKGYPFDSVNKAVNKYLNTLNDGNSPIESSPSEEVFGSIYDTKMLIKEIEDGDMTELIKVKDDLMANGKSITSIKMSLTSYFKAKLHELNKQGNTAEVMRIREILVSEFGYRRSEIADWLK